MDSPTYLAAFRRLLQDTDDVNELYTDDDLWNATADAVVDLQVRGAVNYPGYTIDTVGTDQAFSTDPTNEYALLTMKQAALMLLTAVYRGKVNRGELGGSWKSGLEEESTSTTQRAFAASLAELEQQVDALLILRARQVFATRVQ